MASNPDVPVRLIEPSTDGSLTAGPGRPETSDMERAMKRLRLTGLTMTAALVLAGCTLRGRHFTMTPFELTVACRNSEA
jgi:hypothetical protein